MIKRTDLAKNSYIELGGKKVYMETNTGAIMVNGVEVKKGVPSITFRNLTSPLTEGVMGENMHLVDYEGESVIIEVPNKAALEALFKALCNIEKGLVE